MASATCFRLLCIMFLVKGIHMITLNRMVERMNHIESRLISETKYRTEDMAVLLTKLDDMNAKLNKLTASGEASYKENTDIHSEEDNTQNVDSIGNIKSQFVRVLKGFEDEKRANSRTRRQVSALQMRIDGLNKLPTFMETMFNQNENSMNEIRNDIKYVHEDLTKSLKNNKANDDIIRIHIDIIESINETRNDITLVHGDLAESINDIKGDITRVQGDLTESINEVKDDIKQVLVHGNLSMSMNEANVDITRVHLSYPRSCADSQNVENGNDSNVYDVYRSGKRIKVFCDQQTEGGGWTVFQRREDGSENFNRSWSDYKEGFGNLQGEFWLGNENLHLLTNEGVKSCELRVDMTSFDDDTAFAKYSWFKVGSENDKYKLKVGGYTGTSSDAMYYHDGKDFETYDKPGKYNCAMLYHANWHGHCYTANPNGIYFKARDATQGGIKWIDWKEFDYSLKHIEMKFRCRL